jgi:hypothetical protein
MSRALAVLVAGALLGGALASCASTEPGSSATSAADDLGLPAVRGPLVFPAGAREVTLGWLVDELARLSDQELSLAPELRQELDTTAEPLEQTTDVPAREVYTYVEALLAMRGVVVAPLKGGARPMLGLRGRRSGPAALEAVLVDPERCASLAAHPALLCQVLLTFENIDARQLQTQLRQLLVDESGLQQVVPTGERGLLIRASGAKLHGLVTLLREADRAAAPPQPAGTAELPR